MDLENSKETNSQEKINFYSNIYKQNISGYNDYIVNFVKLNNKIWEENLCNIIVDNIENNKEFIDIGANIGLVTLGITKIAFEKGKKIGNIHCFECDTQTFRMLVDNTQYSTDNCINLYPFAISDKLQLCSMSENRYNRGCNFIYRTIDNNSILDYNYPFIPLTNNYEKRLFVPSINLDIIDYQFKNIGVIKIDVEGFEYFVLIGAYSIIMKYKPVIIIEIWDINKEKIFALMEDIYKYTIEFIEEQNYICKPKL
jgi:FkbM family methyltransferase